ncbi:MAG: hypothetical protein V4474_01850 [Patescibacteria group bacterium]
MGQTEVRIGPGYWLRDDEIERHARMPLRNAKAECAMADEMRRSRKNLWIGAHPGETVVINARTLKEAFGATHDKAVSAHKAKHGASQGDYMIAQLLVHSRPVKI